MKIQLEKKHDRLMIIDFDHTVFNTTTYLARLVSHFERHFGISEKEFMEKRNGVKEMYRVIDIENFSNQFPGQDPEELRTAIHHVIKKYAAESVFPDMRDFIDRHKDRFDIILMTHGDMELQSEKIEHSNLPMEVQKNISLDSKGELVGELQNVYDEIHFIDDKAENIDAVKAACDTVQTYHVQRHDDNPYDDAPACACSDHEIHDMNFDVA